MNRITRCLVPFGLLAVIHAAGETVFVDASATCGTNNGQSWANAFTDLQDALALNLSEGDEIWVANGTYYPVTPYANPTTTDREVSFVLPKGVAIYGGFHGLDLDPECEEVLAEGEEDPSERNEFANPTILDGDIDTGTGGLHSYHVVYADATGLDTGTKLSGFTIRNGRASASSGVHSVGGGILLNGVTVFGSATAGPSLNRLTICENQAYAAGGGMYSLNYSHGFLVNVTFKNNTTTDDESTGGALCFDGKGYGLVQNGVFYSNTSGGVGGGCASLVTTPIVLANCTFYGNSATGISGRKGHAVYIQSGSAQVQNSIVWGNGSSGLQLDGPSDPATSYFWVRYSDIQDSGYSGSDGNISANPRFRDADNGVLSLTGCSPCVDSGVASLDPPGPPTVDNLLLEDTTDVNDAYGVEELTPWDLTPPFSNRIDPGFERRVRYHEPAETPLAEVLDMGATEECPGDFDGNKKVDISDLTQLLSVFGEADCSSGPCARANFDCANDGIDISDLSFLLSNFGQDCLPGNHLSPPGGGGVSTSVTAYDTSAYSGSGFEGEKHHFVFDVFCTIAESADDWIGSGVTVTVANGATLRLVPNAGNPPTPGDSIPEKYTTFFGEPRAVTYSGRFTNPLPNGAIAGKYTGAGAFTYTSTAINAAWYDNNPTSNDGPAAVLRIVINVSGVSGADTSGGLGSVYFTTGSPGSGDIKVADMTFDVEHKYADSGSTVTVGSFYVTD